MEIKKEEYTTIRIRRDLLYKLIELRGKLKISNPDKVIEYLLNNISHKKEVKNPWTKKSKDCRSKNCRSWGKEN